MASRLSHRLSPPFGRFCENVEAGPAAAGETVDYFVEAPDGLSQSNRYAFGPAYAAASDPDLDDATDSFDGEDADNYVFAQSQP